MLPPELKTRATQYARQRGLSLGALLRECLQKAVDASRSNGRREDPLFADDAIFKGPSPSDLSDRHDEYLYGEEKG